MLARSVVLALVVLGVACTDRVAETASRSFEQFETATVVVTTGEVQRRLPVWLAQTADQQRRGLMEVTDPELGGRVGMAFWFPSPTQGGFWMRNTRLPLTIVFVADDGHIVSTAEMEPCPDSEPDCPITAPAGVYRWALEVPTSRWAALGLTASDRLALEWVGVDTPSLTP